MTPNTLTEAHAALTARGHSWKVELLRQDGDGEIYAPEPGAPRGADDIAEYLSVSFPERTDNVVEVFVSTCDCSCDDEGNGHTEDVGPEGRGFMVVWLDSAGVDEVAEDHVTPEELSQYAYYWLIDPNGAAESAGPDEPNPFCTNRSEAGDACGACAGCLAEMERIRAVFHGSSEVLIHLNVTFPTDDQAEARRLAESYLAAHEIPSADVALIDPQ